MSNRYKGGIISATPPTTTGGETGVASGAWTLEQQLQAQAAGLWPLQPVPVYIEDVFSTWLYTGNGSPLTINNGIDLAGKGGLTWFKDRTTAQSHVLIDSVRGTNKTLFSNETRAEVTQSWSVTYNSNGMTLPGSAVDSSNGVVNFNGYVMASWTFREQPKFFDVVTYTGNGTNQTLNHNLGSVPGCMIVKSTSATGAWYVYHRSSEFNPGQGWGTAGSALILNSSAAVAGSGQYWAFTPPTATQFTVGAFSGESILTNIAGVQYVAYLFAHNAGGFGLTGTDNVISCGSFTSDGSSPISVNLGYEPQWILMKASTSAAIDWFMFDNMRGTPVGSGPQQLYANSAIGENTGNSAAFQPNATGFTAQGSWWGANTMIYIAIRRGPMRTPTTGTSVFDPELTAAAAGTTVTTNFPIDLQLYRATGVLDNIYAVDRLRGVNTTAVNTVTPLLFTSTNGSEATDAVTRAWNNTGFQTPLTNGGTSSIYWNFRRAPGFFDEICFTVSGSVPLVHNLGVTPELVIYKTRNAADSWWTCANVNGVGQINNTGAWALTGLGNGLTAVAQATSATISNLNGVLLSPGNTVVAYLFASAPGVSKVGSYTGTGTTQLINCGFTGGARFVLIKATSTTGDWYVWDTARGMIPANDPYLRLNSTAAEVTGTDWVDTAATGFELSNAGGNLANSNGVSYIFLAIA